MLLHVRRLSSPGGVNVAPYEETSCLPEELKQYRRNMRLYILVKGLPLVTDFLHNEQNCATPITGSIF